MRLPLWAWAPAGVCLGLTAALALSPGGLPWAIGVVVGITLMASRPWAVPGRRLDRMHESVRASQPLRHAGF